MLTETPAILQDEAIAFRHAGEIRQRQCISTTGSRNLKLTLKTWHQLLCVRQTTMLQQCTQPLLSDYLMESV